jgi:predicted phage gp36 major capsid-like protein
VSEIKDDLKDVGERMKADMKKGSNKIQTESQDQLTEQKNGDKEISDRESDRVKQSPSTEIPSDEIQIKIKSNKQTSTTTKNDNESVSQSSES